MSFFQGATHVEISGGTQIAAGAGSTVNINQIGRASLSSALKDLSAAAAHTALHNSAARYDAPRCYRNTRTSYLDAFERWTLGLGGDYDSKRLIWLTGGAGAGKSAIVQSTVERCIHHSAILGAFFFSRTDPSRNHADVLIPTLAYQLARMFPAAMDVLGPCIQHDPLIFKASLRTQAYELLARPLAYLIETGVIDDTSPLRRVFVIDGLDECDDPQQQAEIIRVVSTILCDHAVPVSFLIASRPEIAISRAFQRESNLKVHSFLSSITLDDNEEASSDIRQFVEDSFLDILDTHPMRARIPENWPDPHSVDELVRKASGHFIYVATAMRFISSSSEHPARALKVVEGLVPSRQGNPFVELDTLYLHILTSAKYGSQVLKILRHCTLTIMDNSAKALCHMYPEFSPEDIELFLSDVQALVTLSSNHAAEVWVFVKHASLSDFFRDADRSQAVYMSREEYMGSLLTRYFLVLDSHYLVDSLFSQYDNPNKLLVELTKAVTHSQDISLLASLIRKYTTRHVWNFYLQFWVNSTMADRLAFAAYWVSLYTRAIRDSAANHDNTLYIDQFKIFVQVLIDDLKPLFQEQPHHRIIPALIFSSSRSGLTSLAPHLIEHFPSEILYHFAFFFSNLESMNMNVNARHATDPRSYEAIRSLPQTNIPWGSDLASGLQLVLRRFVRYTWTPECLYPNPHERWLRNTKPMKLTSQGSPRLSPNAHYLYPRTQNIRSITHQKGYNALLRYQHLDYGTANRRSDRREKCLTYLKTIVHYLRKCDCTSALAKLARRSLPKAALWFPKLMKRARAEMDAYLRRWEESLDGLLERLQSLTINEMD